MGTIFLALKEIAVILLILTNIYACAILNYFRNIVHISIIVKQIFGFFQ